VILQLILTVLCCISDVLVLKDLINHASGKKGLSAFLILSFLFAYYSKQPNLSNYHVLLSVWFSLLISSSSVSAITWQ